MTQFYVQVNKDGIPVDCEGPFPSLNSALKAKREMKRFDREMSWPDLDSLTYHLVTEIHPNLTLE